MNDLTLNINVTLCTLADGAAEEMIFQKTPKSHATLIFIDATNMTLMAVEWNQQL